MTEQELIKCIHIGIHETNNLYMRWSGGYSIRAYGVENFMVGNVTNYIMQQSNHPKHAKLEIPFSELYESCNKYPKGRRTERNKDNNRLDLALYNKNNLIHALEFKRFWEPKCLNDIDRLHNLLKNLSKKNGGLVSTGIFVLLVSCLARDETAIEKKIYTSFNIYKEKCSEYLERNCLYKGISKYYFSHSTKFVSPKIANNGRTLASLCLVMK